MRHLVVSALLMAMPAVAYASNPPTVPEPETLALLGVGAVALIIARWRRKK